jgi:DNA-binding response OmpR family regulator
MLLTRPPSSTIETDILVVGGDAATSDMYCALLRAGGWRVHSAATIAAALDRDAARPRLILVCGWEAVVSFLERAPHLLGATGTVVVAHCSASPEAIAAALDGGIDIFIPQPCSAPVLVRRLRAALRFSVVGGREVE